MSNNFGIGKALLIAIGVGIILPIVFIFAFRMGESKERNYVHNGVLTPCTVDTVLTVAGKQQVSVVYQNASGQTIKAKAILNKKVRAGEVVEAYVLASDPYEVYYPASPILKWVLYGIIAVAAIAAWIPLIVVRRQGKIDKLAAQARAMNKKNDWDI